MLVMKEGMGRLIYYNGKNRERGNADFIMPKTLDFKGFPAFLKRNGLKKYFHIEKRRDGLLIEYKDIAPIQLIQEIISDYVSKEFDWLNMKRKWPVL